jgi:hypothetical protein
MPTRSYDVSAYTAAPVPLVVVKSIEDLRRETYVVCLDCGKEFLYDLKAMRVGAPAPAQTIQPQLKAQRTYGK